MASKRRKVEYLGQLCFRDGSQARLWKPIRKETKYNGDGSLNINYKNYKAEVASENSD